MANVNPPDQGTRWQETDATATGTGWRPAAAGPPLRDHDFSLDQDQRPSEGPAVIQPQPPGPGALRGEARGIQIRTEPDEQEIPKQIWTFRINRFDSAGNALPPIPVEMRAQHFDGAISEGDWVEVSGRWEPGQLLIVSEILNLTTNSRVGARKESHLIGFIVLGVVITIMVLIVAAGVFLALSSQHHF